MDELFDAKQVAGDSPRLRWIKRHRLTIRATGAELGEEDDNGDPVPQWLVYRERVTSVTPFEVNMLASRIGRGNTEDDALADWARRNGQRLWNEV